MDKSRAIKYISVMLEVNSLNVTADIKDNPFHILRDVSFNICKGEILGVAGESGSGKSILSKTIIGLINKPVVKTAGDIILCGKKLQTQEDFRSVRGNKISMIFQNPTASLNPVFKIGDQIIETILLHNPSLTKKQAWTKSVELLEEVEIRYPEDRMNSYPHQLSGGMNQRVMIALALSSNPEILIADEPTTALDVTIQKQIINLIKKLNTEKKLSVMFITHDIKLLTDISTRNIIMYSGEIMEIIDSPSLFNGDIKHPYTFSLKKCIPAIEKRDELYTIPGNVEHNTALFENKCIFENRCFNAKEKCSREKPNLGENNCKCFFPL